MRHRLDHRVDLLTDAIEARIRLFENVLWPEGGGPPFMESVTTEAAITFWKRHRSDEIGRQVLAGYTPAQVAELDAWITAASGPPEVGP